MVVCKMQIFNYTQIMNTLYRKEKISMFLIDYYFGFGRWITTLRLIGNI